MQKKKKKKKKKKKEKSPIPEWNPTPSMQNPKQQKHSHRSLSERVRCYRKFRLVEILSHSHLSLSKALVKACLILTMSARLARPLNKWPGYVVLATPLLAIPLD